MGEGAEAQGSARVFALPPVGRGRRAAVRASSPTASSAGRRLLVEIAPRLGVGLRPSTWAQVFDTDDGVIAGNFLTALGCHAACDQGFAVDEPEEALRGLLSAISRRMGPAIELLPHFVKSLRSSGSAPTEMLRAAVDAALEVVGEPPPSWQPMLGELESGRPTLLN